MFANDFSRTRHAEWKGVSAGIGRLQLGNEGFHGQPAFRFVRRGLVAQVDGARPRAYISNCGFAAQERLNPEKSSRILKKSSWPLPQYGHERRRRRFHAPDETRRRRVRRGRVGTRSAIRKQSPARDPPRHGLPAAPVAGLHRFHANGLGVVLSPQGNPGALP